MSIIRVLPEQVANQIAAGEVVERPVAVIKELVENSIDAGATRIEVEFRQGGKAYMRVEDDGKGMDEEDCMLCLERHATSKIKSADDLNSLYSFGFRGEALPSIASVSRFTLQSRPHDQESGTEVLVNGGKLIHKRECGMPPGTRLEVANLFNSVPARRKFLKTDQTEAAHIVQLIRLLAIAHPNISFTLQDGPRVLFRSPICKDLKDRIAEIYSTDVANDLIPVEGEKDGYKMKGLIGKAGTGRATRQEMITLVNNRPVDSRILNFAIVEAYHAFIAKGRYPVAFLFLEIDPSEIDINVHPSKKEIRFHNEGKVRNLIIEAIIDRLSPKQTLLTPKKESEEDPKKTRSSEIPQPVIPEQKTTTKQAARSQPLSPTPIQTVSKDAPSAVIPKTSSSTILRQESVPEKPEPITPPVSEPVFHWSFIGMHKKNIALFEGSDGLIALHCKAAQERILFEKIETYLHQDQKASQKLLLPIPIELDPLANATLVAIRTDLEKSGFSIEEFGRNFYRIQAIPAWMEPETAKLFLIDIIDVVMEQGHLSKNKKITDQIFTKLAVNRTSQSMSKITPGEAIQIAKKLLLCQTIHTSPTGKPTYIEFTNNFFSEKFARKI